MKRRGVFTAGGVGQVAIALGATILIAGCPDGGTQPDPLAVNAGADQAGETGDTFTLNAGATVTGGTNPAAEWTLAGPSSPAIINDTSVNGATVTINLAGTYTATLGALDANNNFAADTIQITVTDPPPPVITVSATADNANPGAANGGDTVQLSATTAGDVPPTSFAWQLTASGTAGTVNLQNANSQTATATFSQDAEGTFTFAVTVGDSAAPTAGAGSDSVDVVVTASPDPANTIFTLNLDNLVGTSEDDDFIAPLDLVNGAQTPTLQNADTAVGMGGNDTLMAFDAGAGANVVTPNLTGIGEVHIQNFRTGLHTLNTNTSTGITHVASDNSTNAVSVTNLIGLADASITNNAQNLTLAFQNAATAAANDVMNLTLSNTTMAGGTFTVTTAANGIETLNVDSVGAENSVTLVQNIGNTLTTINTTGDQLVTFLGGALPGTVTALNAAGQTAGGTVATAPNTNFAFTGGAGDDGIDFSVDAFAQATDSADGGAGTDAIAFTTAQIGAVVATLTNVTGFETIESTNALANILTTSFFNLNSNVNLPAGFNGGTVNIASGDTVGLGLTDFATAKADSGGNGIIEVPGAGTNDSATVILSDHDSGNNVTLNGIESVAIESNLNVNGAAADGGANVITGTTIMAPTFGTGTATITGTEDLTLTGATTIGAINAGAFGQAFTMGTPSTIATQITSGGGADQLRGSTENDIISAGDGNDNVSGEGGAAVNGQDIVTLGGGADILQVRFAGANGNDRQIVTDFDDTPTSGDVVNVDADDLVTLDGTDNFATAASIQTHGVAGNLAVAAATEVVRVTSATVVNFTDANSLNGTNLLAAIGGTITVQNNGDEILFAVANPGGDVGIYFGDAGANTDVAAGELTLVAVLQGANVTLANLVFNNFTNVNGL